jgi:tetratricopeptide (TPR) repeat protein
MLLAPLLLLALAEVALRVAGFGYSTHFFLPLRVKEREALVENERFGWRFFGPEMARSSFPFVLPKEKAPGTTRIFVFGESAAYGDPQPEFGLPRMLEALLSLRFPDRHFEVVNTGITGINSHVILPIARDCADKQGDFWVIYMGNNEVVGPFGSGTVFGPKAPPRALVRFSLAFKATRLGQLFDQIVRHFQKRSARDSVWGGMPMFVKNHVRKDDPRMATVYANFQANLDDIISLGTRSGAQVIVSSMARNVRDFAPFASEPRPGISAEDAARWNDLFQRGETALAAGNAQDANEQFQKAAAIDDSQANLRFLWGKALLAQGKIAEAREQFNLACDADALRFRSDARINDIIRQAAVAHQPQGVRFVDAQEVLGADSPNHIVGDDFLYEHVHLNFEGNYRLALAIARQIFPTNSIWPSEAECARRLSFTDFNRSEAAREIVQRENDAPYTSQIDHDEEYARAKKRYEALFPATELPALQREKAMAQDTATKWPNDWVVQQNLGLLAQETGDSAAAAAAFQRVTDLLPQSHDAWKTYGVALSQINHTNEAAAAFAEALRLRPDDVPTLVGLAEMAASHGQNDEAARYYHRILQVQPFFGPAHLGLGKILDAEGKHDEAQAEYRKSMEARINTPEAFSGMGKFFYGKGDYATAATNFADEVRISPSDPQAHFNLGICLAQLGRWNDAQHEYAEAVRLDPNFAAAHFGLGLVAGQHGDDARAMEEFAIASRLQPNLVEARLNLGISLFKQRHNQEARQELEAVLQQSPGNKVAQAYLQKLDEPPKQ